MAAALCFSEFAHFFSFYNKRYVLFLKSGGKKIPWPFVQGGVKCGVSREGGVRRVRRGGDAAIMDMSDGSQRQEAIQSIPLPLSKYLNKTQYLNSFPMPETAPCPPHPSTPSRTRKELQLCTERPCCSCGGSMETRAGSSRESLLPGGS